MELKPVWTIALCLLPLVARAQNPAPSPSPVAAHGEYVEVTATRIPEDPDEVAASIDVLSGDELRARGVTDLRGALAVVAGVDVAPGGDNGPASSVPEFWGLKEFDAFLLVVDGVPWGGAFNPALATLDLNVNGVERIEVLRGPAPVMYGATSFVGVIQVVHKAPGTQGGTASVSGGSFGSGSGTVSAPFHWGGFDSTIVADLTRVGFKDDRTQFDRGHALWRNARAVGAGHFGFDLDVAIVNQDPASPFPREGAALSTRIPLDANHQPIGANFDDHRFTGNVRYDRPLVSANWNSVVSFSHAKQDIFRGFLDDLDNPELNAHGFQEEIDYTDLYLDTHLAWSHAKDWRVVVGFDHLHGEGKAKGADFDYFVDLAGEHPPAGLKEDPVPDDDQIEDRREFSGLYAWGAWNPVGRLRLEAGVRLNRTMEERENPNEVPPPTGEDDPGKRTDTKPSGSVGATVTLWEDGARAVRLFGDYRHAFKPAAIDFGIGEEEGGGGEEEALLKPETADCYEGGIKGRLGEDGAFEFEANGFLMDFTNLVVATSVGGLPDLQNAGKERFKGFEAELGWQGRRNLWLRAVYSYHDARFRDFVFEFDPGVPTQLGGKRLEMSPHNMAGGQVAWAPATGLQASADVHYVGSRFLNKRNTAPAEAYTELSASLGWRVRKYEVRVAGHNLSDRRDPVAESELGDAQYYRLPARRVDLSATFRF